MNVKQVKDIFFDRIKEFNEKYGFVSKKGAFKLVKVEKNRTIEIDFTYNTFYDEVELFPCLKIYVHDVMNLAKKCYYADLKGTYVPTVAMYLFHLKTFYEKGEKSIEKTVIEREDRFHLFGEKDVLHAIEHLEEMYKHYGFNETEKFDNLEAVDMLFNTIPEKYNHFHTTWEYQAVNGIIISKLLGRKDHNSIVEAFYKKYNTPKYAIGVKDFECLIKILKDRS